MEPLGSKNLTAIEATRFTLRKTVEKEIEGGNPAIAGNDEIGPGVSWRLTRGV